MTAVHHHAQPVYFLFIIVREFNSSYSLMPKNIFDATTEYGSLVSVDAANHPIIHRKHLTARVILAKMSRMLNWKNPSLKELACAFLIIWNI
jgi:hypothetical protein